MVELLPGDYKVESHVVTTSDGFILKLFRVNAK
jgi:hypothetical protein